VVTEWQAFDSQIRRLVTQRLVAEKGVRALLLEADWPACAHVNRYITTASPPEGQDARQVLKIFDHFPEWMWDNAEFALLVEWLRDYNMAHRDTMVRVYGIDCYALFESARLVIDYLAKVDPEAAARAAHRYGPILQHAPDTHQYGVVCHAMAPMMEDEAQPIVQDGAGERRLRLLLVHAGGNAGRAV
jgi:erythromycin esterase-like protein